jgi:acyl CoA:acetate/3-ketoacid CoA transferase alpha subunit
MLILAFVLGALTAHVSMLLGATLTYRLRAGQSPLPAVKLPARVGKVEEPAKVEKPLPKVGA